MMPKKILEIVDEYDLNSDGLADVTIILINGQKGIYLSFRTIAVLAITAYAVITDVIGQIF